MDIPLLAQSLTTALAPFLPHLIKAGDKAAEEVGEKLTGDAWDGAKAIWVKLRSKVEANPSAQKAAKDAAQAPDNKERRTALRVQFEELLTEDEAFASEIEALLTQTKGIGGSRVSADRGGVAFGDNAHGNITITGGAKVDFVIRKPAPPPLPSPHQLRKPLDDFIGREEEISRLIETLRDGGRASVSGISINGMGGIGKTELALLVADRLSQDYPDAQLFIEMQGTAREPLSPAEAFRRCIRAFVGFEARLPDDPDELSTLYRSYLSGKRALILLDNASDRSQILPLMPPVGCALVVTSRTIISLTGMERLRLDQLKPEEARALLREITPRIEPEIADRIGYLCGYLPLAIRAAGSLLDVTIDLDPAQYAEQLFDEVTRLEMIGTEGVEIGVEASFNLSYEGLEPEGARIFRRLSVFPESFDGAAAEFICEDHGRKYLRELLRRSLVVYGRENRYRLHDLVRVIALARLNEVEKEAGERAHAAHYHRVLSTANGFYLEGEGGVRRGLALFEEERVNIEAGWRWARTQAETDQEAAGLCISYPDAGAHVLNLRQHPREQIEWMQTMLIAACSLKRRDAEGRALAILGIAYRNLGEARTAIEYYERHLEITRETGDRRGEGAALGNLGLAYVDLGEARKAIGYYEQYLEITQEFEDRRGEGAALGNLGLAYADLGEVRKAIEYYERRLDIAREMGDRRGEGNTLGSLGIAYKNLGEARKAIWYHEQRLEIAREIGDRRGEGNALGNLGVTYAVLGEAQKSIEYQRQRLEIAIEIGDRRGEGQALGNLGAAYVDLGEMEKAIEYYDQRLKIAREMEDLRGEASSLYGAATTLDALHDRARAVEYMGSALKIYERIEDPRADNARELLSKWREE